jgi:hypothetical protein
MAEPGRSGQVVVCGLHADCLRTIEQLHLAGVRLVVVDDEPDVRLVGTLTGWGIPLVRGDFRLPETLVGPYEELLRLLVSPVVATLG